MTEPNRLQRKRRGAAMVEAAIVLPVCAMLLIGMFDCCLLVIRYTAMGAAARQVAREAMVHGSRATPSQGSWGPLPLTTTASDNHQASKTAKGLLMAQDPSQVSINLTWPDGANAPGNRVRASVSCTHWPLLAIPGWYGATALTGTSTMTIAH